MSTQTRAFIRGKISLHKIKTVDAKCYNFKTLVEVTLGFGKSINQYLIMYKIWQILNRFVGTFLSSNFPKIGRSVYTQYIFSIPTLINTLPGHVVLIIWLNYMFLMPMFGCNLKIKKQATNSGEKTTETTETSALSTGTVHSHCSKIFQRVHTFLEVLLPNIQVYYEE